MNLSTKQILGFVIATTFLIVACGLGQTEKDPEQLSNLVMTSVGQTLTAFPTSTPIPTDTPSPTPTEVIPTIQPTTVVPLASPTSIPVATAKSGYLCDIINQKPFDDTPFRPRDSFDIRWTIVNTGTQKWEDETYLKYQSGSQMTDVTEIKLPKLKPGDKYEIILEAIAPSEAGMQVMVWAVVGPGSVKDSVNWMCYPYARIIVK